MAAESHVINVLGTFGQVRFSCFIPIIGGLFEGRRQGPLSDLVPRFFKLAPSLFLGFAGYGAAVAAAGFMDDPPAKLKSVSPDFSFASLLEHVNSLPSLIAPPVSSGRAFPPR